MGDQNYFWTMFVEQGKHMGSWHPDYLQAEIGRSEFEQGCMQEYQHAQAFLKQVLIPAQSRALNNRYRQFKSKLQHAKKTLTLGEETLVKLDKAKSKLRLDSYEMLFEYLLEPDESVQIGLKQLSTQQLESALTWQQQFELLMIKHPNKKRLLQEVIRSVYIDAWNSAKETKGRSLSTLETALESNEWLQLITDV